MTLIVYILIPALWANCAAAIRALCVRMDDRELQGFGADFMALARISLWCEQNDCEPCIAEGRYDKVPDSGSPKSWHYYVNSLKACTQPCDAYANWHGPENHPRWHPQNSFRSTLQELYKPTESIAKSSLLRNDGLDCENSVVLHIRRGDKISGAWKETTTEHPSLSVQAYYDAAAKAAVSVRRLVLLCDEEETIEEIERINQKRGHFGTISFSKHETRRGGFGQAEMLQPLSAEDLEDEARVFFSLIEAMRSARVLVGARLSTVFVMAELLRGPASQTVSIADNPSYPTGYIYQPAPVFVVNLARRTERMDRFAAQAHEHGVAYERIEASDADAARAALESGHIALNQTFRDPSSGRRMKLGEVGCALSHIRVWERIARLPPDQYAVVLEDDAKFIGFADKLPAVVDESAKLEAEFVYLAYRDRAPQAREASGQLLQSCGFTYWTIAYLIRASAAARLIEERCEYEKNMIPVDEFLPIVLGARDTGHEMTSDSCSPRTGECRPTSVVGSVYSPRLACYAVREQIVSPYFDDSPSDTESSGVVPGLHQSAQESVVVLTVATDVSHFGYQTLLRSADYYGYDLRTLGANETWTGGDMAAGPGGGMKVSLVKRALLSMDGEELVLFVDGYDTVFQHPPSVLLEHWQESEKTTDVLFGAEVLCWPSEAVCAQYAEEHERFRYLNSGTYMGRVKHLRALVEDFVSSNSSDDQLYFSRKLRDHREGTLATRIALDSECHVFQPLNGLEAHEWQCESPGYRFRNTETQTEPVVLHGNGPSSRTLVGLSNYVAGAYSDFYKTTRHSSDDSIDVGELALGLFFFGTPFEAEFIETVENLDLDYKRTTLFVWRAPGVDVRLGNAFRTGFRKNGKILTDDYAEARALFLENAASEGARFAFMIQSDALLNRASTVRELAQWNTTVVAAFLQRELGVWSSFWTDMRPDGWYRRGFDALRVYRRENVGLFQVPYAHSALLFRRDMFATFARYFRRHKGTGDDAVRRACVDALGDGVPVYADNRHLYGTLLGEEGYTKAAAPHPELYEAHVSPSLWAKRYLVEDYERVQMAEPCPDAYGAVLFTPLFCEHLIATANAANQWSSGRNEDERVGGYENVPTQDIHMNQFGWEEQWVYVLKNVLAPLIERQYRGISFKAEINIAFVVKYSMDGQRDLRPHNDASQVTTTVLLNDAFTGGGVQFTRYNCTHVSREPGFLLMHPGRVTHNHLAYPITSGKRFVIVSFNE